MLAIQNFIDLSRPSPLSHAADTPAEAGRYLTLYAAPRVRQDDDPHSWSTAGGKQLAPAWV